jgi:small-conductance mechanosensitive channel
MYFAQFFRLSYWFSIPLTENRVTYIVLWSLCALALVAAIGLRAYQTRVQDSLRRKILIRFSNVAFFFGILGLILTFFRKETLPLLSWRIWSLIVLGITLYWLYGIIRYLRVRVPEIRKQNAERERFEKYLPKKAV